MTTKKKTEKKPVGQFQKWNNVNGVMRVWAKEFSHKGKTRLNYSTSIGKKHDNDEYYDNVYYDVLFKQANKPFLPDNSFEIYIKKGFLTVTTYNDGSIHPAVMVMEYELKDDITADDIPF